MLLLSVLSLAVLALRPSSRVTLPVQALPTAVVGGAPAVSVPPTAVVGHLPRQVATAPQPSTPAPLALSSQPNADRVDCNSAIAAVLVDNSAANRGRRDRVCGKPTPEPTSTTP